MPEDENYNYDKFLEDSGDDSPTYEEMIEQLGASIHKGFAKPPANKAWEYSDVKLLENKENNEDNDKK